MKPRTHTLIVGGTLCSALLAFGACSSDSGTNTDNADQVQSALDPVSPFQCRRAIRQCVEDSCRDEIRDLLASFPFSPRGIRAIRALQECAQTKCGNVCNGTGGAAGAGGAMGAGGAQRAAPVARRRAARRPPVARLRAGCRLAAHRKPEERGSRRSTGEPRRASPGPELSRNGNCARGSRLEQHLDFTYRPQGR
jgi:hypothetical protein